MAHRAADAALGPDGRRLGHGKGRVATSTRGRRGARVLGAKDRVGERAAVGAPYVLTRVLRVTAITPGLVREPRPRDLLGRGAERTEGAVVAGRDAGGGTP